MQSTIAVDRSNTVSRRLIAQGKFESMPVGAQRIVNLAIECTELPPHDWGGHEIWLGIQKGKDVIEEAKLPADGVVFHADLRLSQEGPPAKPNFLGPFAHGTAEDRFIYLCWGRRYGAVWHGFRRAKLPLSGLTWEILGSDRPRVQVRCTDAKGGPICATIKSDRLTWR